MKKWTKENKVKVNQKKTVIQMIAASRVTCLSLGGPADQGLAQTNQADPEVLVPERPADHKVVLGSPVEQAVNPTQTLPADREALILGHQIVAQIQGHQMDLAIQVHLTVIQMPPVDLEVHFLGQLVGHVVGQEDQVGLVVGRDNLVGQIVGHGGQVGQTVGQEGLMAHPIGQESPVSRDQLVLQQSLPTDLKPPAAIHLRTCLDSQVRVRRSNLHHQAILLSMARNWRDKVLKVKLLGNTITFFVERKIYDCSCLIHFNGKVVKQTYTYYTMTVNVILRKVRKHDYIFCGKEDL